MRNDVRVVLLLSLLWASSHAGQDLEDETSSLLMANATVKQQGDSLKCSDRSKICRLLSNCPQLDLNDEAINTKCFLKTKSGNQDEFVSVEGICCSKLELDLYEGWPLVKMGAAKGKKKGGSWVSWDDLSASSENGFTFSANLEQWEANNSVARVSPNTPSAGHLRVFNVSEAAREVSVRALQLAAASAALANRLGLEDADLRHVSLEQTRLGKQCPKHVQCPTRLGKYRVHDGSCSNPRRPWLGRALSPLQRLLPAHYDDGIQAPRMAQDGGSLPSARLISSLLSTDGDRAPLDRQLSALVADFGQFLDHDLVQSPIFTLKGGSGIQCCTQDGSQTLPPQQRHPQCMPIDIPFNDNFFARFGQGCMNFVRTMPAVAHNCSLGAINQMNSVTHWLDGSMIYGASGVTARNLVGPRGQLLTSGQLGRRSLLPSQPGGCTRRSQNENANFCFSSGDMRVNEQPSLTSLHTVFMREHNRVAATLSAMHPEFSDDAVYQEARRVVVAQIQHITYNEFLPIVLGRPFMRAYGLSPLVNNHSADYNADYDATVTNEFAAAAFRLHSLVRSDLILSLPTSDRRLPLSNALNSPQVLFWPDAGDALLRGQMSRPLGAFDHVFSNELTQRLFQSGGGFGLDILSLSIQRGRDHGLPSYNSYRKLCGLKKARSFSDLADHTRPEVLPILQRLYKNVEDIDLYVGGITERRSSGALLGHTFLCLVGDQFARLKKGDRFFYDLQNQPSSFTLDQLNEIRKTSLARILCDNTMDVTEMQRMVFWQQDDTRNPIVSCASSVIPRVNLAAWKKEFPDA